MFLVADLSAVQGKSPQRVHAFTLFAACSFWVAYTPRRTGGPTPIPRVTAPTLLCEWRTTRDLMGATSSAGKAADTHGRLRWISGERARGGGCLGMELQPRCTYAQFTRRYCRDHGHRGIHPHHGYPGCLSNTHGARCASSLTRIHPPPTPPSKPLRSPVCIFRLYPVMCTVFRGSWRYSFPAKSNNYHLIR